MTDQLIGNYRILEKIGAGGMAKVYLAVHKDVPNLKVILKILTDTRLVERFKQEADKLALLDGNPNICRIKHFFNHGEDIVIAMEYIDGVTLDDKLKTDGRFTIDESLRIIRDVLGVLNFAHGKGIYHRDIKPSNVMIDKAGNVKVIDFGIAKAESDPSLTIAGTSCGTPPYMAPEQFTPSEDTNYALVDIYAVGTTLYRMISGELPFKGDNEFAIRDAKLFTEPPSLKEKVPAVSKQLNELVMRTLKKNPLDRFSSATDMIEAVECIRCKESKQPATTQVKTKGKSPGIPSVKILGIAVAVIVVAAAVHFGPGLFSSQTPQTPSLLTPETGAILEKTSPTLSWDNTGAESYTLEYANNSQFFISEFIENIPDTSYNFSDSLDNGAYFWRVQAASDGKTSEYSEAFSFTVRGAIPRGMLAVSVQPEGNIYVDDELMESSSSGISRLFDTGQHVLRVTNSKAVKKEFRETVVITPDTTVSLSYKFRFPAGTPTPPAQQKPASTLGELTIGSKPTIGADVYINDQLQSRKTPSAFKLEPGLHTVRAVLVLDGQPLERSDTARNIRILLTSIN